MNTVFVAGVANTPFLVGSSEEKTLGDQAPQQATINCPKCNKDVAAGTKFCPDCGEKIEG